VKDGDAIAADLSDPDLFELWIHADSADTFEEWAAKRCGVQSVALGVYIDGTSNSWPTGSIFYSIR
jgi:hypothetical protein